MDPLAVPNGGKEVSFSRVCEVSRERLLLSGGFVERARARERERKSARAREREKEWG